MAAIDPIIVTLGPGGQTVSRVGFGNPMIAGFTGSRSVLKKGNNQSSLIFKSVVRRDELSVKIVVAPAAFDYVLNGTELTITAPADTTVRELRADFDANAPQPVKDLYILDSTSLGLDPIVRFDALEDLVPFEGKVLIISITQLDFFYDKTDKEFEMFIDQFATKISPQNKFLLDVFGLADPSAAVASVIDGTWYCLLTTSTTQSEQQNLGEMVVQNFIIAIFVVDDIADTVQIQDSKIVYVVHDVEDDHPENAWAAKVLPKLPGSTVWAFQGPLANQTANENTDLQFYIDVRNANANAYVELNGLTYMDFGITSDPVNKTFIDQRRSRDWVTSNLNRDLNQLLVNEDKIEYDNPGIQKFLDVIDDRLEQAGNNRIIKRIETQEEAATSSRDTFVYSSRSATRQEIEAAAPQDIIDRGLRGVTFEYKEAGAIQSATVSGIILIPN